VPSPEELRSFVGPPMLESFRGPAGLDEDTAQKALQYYRKAYADEGAGQSTLYEGIPEMLQRLTAAGVPMAVATSKIEDQAIRMARNFGLDQHFVSICGASDRDRRATKTEVIAELLLRLGRAGVDLSNPVMLGDRSYDVAGAASHGIPTVFAAWGYGTPSEAEAAAFIASSPLAALETLLTNDSFPPVMSPLAPFGGPRRPRLPRGPSAPARSRL
jgi:phosphoglycolate phosphatase